MELRNEWIGRTGRLESTRRASSRGTCELRAVAAEAGELLRARLTAEIAYDVAAKSGADKRYARTDIQRAWRKEGSGAEDGIRTRDILLGKSRRLSGVP